MLRVSRKRSSSDSTPLEFPVEVRPTAGAMLFENILGGAGVALVLFLLMWMTGIGNHAFRLIAALGVGAISCAYYSLRFWLRAPSFVRIDDEELLIEGSGGIDRWTWGEITRAAHRSVAGLRWEFYDVRPDEFGSIESEPPADGEDGDEADEAVLSRLDELEPLGILRDDGFSSERWTLVSRAITAQLERREIPIAIDGYARPFQE